MVKKTIEKQAKVWSLTILALTLQRKYGVQLPILMKNAEYNSRF